MQLCTVFEGNANIHLVMINEQFWDTFPWQDFFQDISLTVNNIPDISLTCSKFPDISRFSKVFQTSGHPVLNCKVCKTDRHLHGLGSPWLGQRLEITTVNSKWATYEPWNQLAELGYIGEGSAAKSKFLNSQVLPKKCILTSRCPFNHVCTISCTQTISSGIFDFETWQWKSCWREIEVSEINLAGQDRIVSKRTSEAEKYQVRLWNRFSQKGHCWASLRCKLLRPPVSLQTESVYICIASETTFCLELGQGLNASGQIIQPQVQPCTGLNWNQGSDTRAHGYPKAQYILCIFSIAKIH